jgi:hypothetical protein
MFVCVCLSLQSEFDSLTRLLPPRCVSRHRARRGLAHVRALSKAPLPCLRIELRELKKRRSGGDYSTVNSAQRLSATLSIRPSGRAQIIDMGLGTILVCKDIRTSSANLQLCAKNLCVSDRLSARSVMICERFIEAMPHLQASRRELARDRCASRGRFHTGWLVGKTD